MLPHQFDELLAKFSNGKCTPEEEKFILDWYNAVGKFEDTRLDEAEKIAVQERIWSAINPGKPEKKQRIAYLKWAAIIALPLLVLAGIYFQRKTANQSVGRHSPPAVESALPAARFYNNGDNVREIALSDGSVVMLQPASELIVNRHFSDNTREVRLKGEAFFNVKRDPRKPFIVYANEVVTKVLGTSFNIRAYDGDRDVTVAVKTGKVSVYANKTKRSDHNHLSHTAEVILLPNQEMVYHRGDDVLSKRLVDQPQIILPHSHLFSMQFENTAVSEIFEMLEKNYGVEIRYDKQVMSACRLTTSMFDEGLYERIKIICKAIGASYTLEDTVIVIKSKGC